MRNVMSRSVSEFEIGSTRRTSKFVLFEHVDVSVAETAQESRATDGSWTATNESNLSAVAGRHLIDGRQRRVSVNIKN